MLCANGIQARSGYQKQHHHHSTKDHAWNEISGRYVPVEEYYIPENWRQQSEDSKQASVGAIKRNKKKPTNAYTKAITNWKTLLRRGFLELGVAKEQARTL